MRTIFFYRVRVFSSEPACRFLYSYAYEIHALSYGSKPSVGKYVSSIHTSLLM